jgi:hypothetical protein
MYNFVFIPVSFVPQWSHALAEPLLQAGPGGPVLTVERHCLVLGAGCVAATVLHQQGFVLHLVCVGG